MPICPSCGSELEDFSWLEGGYCPECNDWWPSDLIKDFLEEQL